MEVSSIFARYKIKLNDNKVYDPIRRIYVKATPEEIVRQKTIKFLQLRLKVPQDKIIVERALGSLGVAGSRKRIDIGILDADDLIMAVVECKASLVGIDEAAHAQAENYLREINTRYFFVTDGVRFSGYYFNTQQFIKLEEIPQYEEWYWYPKA